MRSLHAITTASLRRVAVDVAASRHSSQRFTPQMRFIARCAGLRHLSSGDAPWLADAIQLICEAICSTPYRAPIRFPAPLLASLELTTTCPHQCAVCYSDTPASPRAGRPSSMSLDTIRLLANSRIPGFLLTGGEPMIHPQISDALSILLDGGRAVVLATNNPPTRIQHVLQHFPRRVHVILSLWGNPERHDLIRGNRSFHRTREHLQQYAKASALVSLNVVLNGPDLSPLEAVGEVIGEHPVHRVYVSRQISVGRGGSGTPLELAPEAIFDACSRLSHRIRSRIVIALPEAAGLRWMTVARDSLLRNLGITLPSTCSAGTWSVHIGVGGQLASCFAAPFTVPSHSTLASMLSGWDSIRDQLTRDTGRPGCRLERTADMRGLA